MRQVEKYNLIAEILKKRSPEVLQRLGDKPIRSLPLETRVEISDILLSEFLEKGLTIGDEPNQYGLQIEDLIDSLGLSND